LFCHVKIGVLPSYFICMVVDYIIIGAGSAGCVLANRLSEDASIQVLLLEAGGKPTMMMDMPGGYAKLHRTKADWGFWTVPQEQVNNRQLYIPRGKVLGGSSNTNAMAYVRGNAEDYDRWAAAGNEGWTYEDLLPYFIKSEHHEKFTDSYHGNKGELNVSFSKYPHLLSGVFLKACAEAGISYNEDYNGKHQLGASLLQFTIKNSKRHSAATAFLMPVLHRKNLQIKMKALVKQILFEKGKATGVEFVDANGAIEKIYCTQEIILSAGTIQSPQILQHSGIGDEKILKQAGIKNCLHLPGVGQNLQDHIWAPVSRLANIPTANNTIKPINMVKAFVQYLLAGRGPLSNSPIEANAFLETAVTDGRPDIQFHMAPLHLGNDYHHDLYDIKKIPATDGFSLMSILLHPESRGTVLVKNDNPLEAPLIQPRFLSAEKDRATFLRGLKKAIEVINAAAFTPYSKGPMHLPVNASTDAHLMEHIKKSLETLYHPVGTCKMGSQNMAVVNNRLQVHGSKSLRVIDASVMPEIVSGNTNAATMMIAEKGADMILKAL
jgi:choline dehydrogenase